MSKFWVITKEVYKKNIKSFGFIVMVLAPILLVGFIAGVGYYFSQQDQTSEPTSVAILSNDPELQALFASEEWNFAVVEEIESEQDARSALENEQIEAYMIIAAEGHTLQSEIVHTNALSSQIPMIAEVLSNYQTMMRANEMDMSPEEVQTLTEPVEIDESVVSVYEGAMTEEDLSGRLIQEWSAYAISIAIVVFIMTYSGIIAEEVANEKGTRIMEIILSSASATNHFFGKLAGVALVMLTQLTIYAVVGTGTYLYFRDTAFVSGLIGELDVVSVLRELMGYTLIFFVAGVLMYVILAAFFGSLATKMEDVNKAVTPIVFIALAGFYSGMFAFASPENSMAVALSYVPLFTPFVMPFRIASGTVGTGAVWLSIIVTFGFTGVISVISLMFYRSNVLVYSDTNLIGTIRRSWSIMQSNKRARNLRA
ncbi:ABC transporter, permease protein [Alkalibacterium sp. AK22]|uniref:ABC transporter permease n=1 Tax=Alkalibacterium sp. AK22 TaxID=1229520 RepID=UPI000448BBCC|nr:ABC transporter permease [Alkalibacterium sp. AK22]EXJ23683.1 ABC transporter, permease protein [Alkalibacterium sp. AK22]